MMLYEKYVNCYRDMNFPLLIQHELLVQGQLNLKTLNFRM